jgi:hypothetical protein
MYKMEIEIAGRRRVLEFRGSYCRGKMLAGWDEYLSRAEAGEDIRRIRVWSGFGGKREIDREWVRPQPPITPPT